MISIVTPWLNASELIPAYEQSTRGAQVVIVDNGSELPHCTQIEAMCHRAGGIYIRNETNALFARANNQGLAAATGDVIVFMNNDVKCQPAFLPEVERDVSDGALFGPSLKTKHHLPYIEGYCIAAKRSTWDILGGWDDQYYEGLYWEDNDLSFRAQSLGLDLVQVDWPIWHYSNYTSKQVNGSYSNSAENERRFLERVKTWPK